MRLGDLARAEDALHRALDVRSPIQFHETTGAVFDTLAQIHLIRGRYDTASDFLGRASEAYGAYGRQTSQWYEWSVRVLGARLALRRGALDEAVARADEILEAGAPPFDALQATLIAAEALTARRTACRRRSSAWRPPPTRSIRRVAPAAWGEYLRLRGALHAKNQAAPPTPITTSRRARRCSICSASAISPASVTSRSAGWSPKPARARSPSAT